MDIHQWIDLPASELKEKLNQELDSSCSFDPLKLYNELVGVAKERPLLVAGIAETLVQVFTEADSQQEALLFRELLARSFLQAGDVDSALATVEKMIEIDSVAAKSIALDIASDMLESPASFGIGIDHLPRTISRVEAIYLRYQMKEEIARSYLLCATIYSSHGASQAAYRILHDAEVIAHEVRSIPLLAHCYATAVEVSCREPDFSWAIDVGAKAMSAYADCDLSPPSGLLCNLGYAHMNSGDLESAIDFFQKVVEKSDDASKEMSAAQLNLASCYRKSGRLEDADMALNLALAAIADEKDHEVEMAIAISAAKLAIASSDVKRLQEQLQAISERLDGVLGQVLRLHHRRGIREHYIRTIEGLLQALPGEGRASDVLQPLVCTHGNAMGDWLAILSWRAGLEAESSLPAQLLSRLDAILSRIREMGAPHLYGFREKYDDPWSPNIEGSAWDDLSELCAQLRDMGLPLPLALATSGSQASLCMSKLRDGHCMMFMTYAGENAQLWVFIGDLYQRVAIPVQGLVKWMEAQHRFSEGSINRATFDREILGFVEVISPSMDSVFKKIEQEECASVCYMEDFRGDLPLNPFVMRNAVLLERMRFGDFHVRIVPAIASSLGSPSDIEKTVSVIDSAEGLLLAPHEGSAFTAAAGLELTRIVQANAREDLGVLLADADALMVSTHGFSLGRFTDAYFARLGGPDGRNLISIEAIQRAAPSLKLGLVILNACYSGSRSNRNFQTTFRTPDSVSIPGMFLLNRRAVAFAGAWKISDTASFVLSHLTGDGLRNGLAPFAALSSAIGRLPTMRREQVRSILSNSLPDGVLGEAIERLRNAPEEGMFSATYFTAGLAIYGLL
ncbi:tetratricopeptide repeat protein [Pseudoxanthomonas sp. CF385]|uniref:tetratricopeptide repeat protein n=1 Tax=Pseudoxanthomonas sp. CF385 TaxID=1881042 RepID=UPI000B828B85|nr:tetratricopeptide repeat protein [Pseudoxanthomonas sp. CF385]